MRTETVTITYYEFNELSQKAKDYAVSEWVTDGTPLDEVWGGSCRNSLNEFCRIMNIKIDYDFNGIDYCYSFITIGNYVGDLSGIRLTKYLWNHVANFIADRKMFWGKNYAKSRTSNLVSSYGQNNELSGEESDYAILNPLVECLHYKRVYDSYNDLIDDCLDAFFKAAVKEYEYTCSEENFAELAEIYDWEFTEEGAMANENF